jgi:hypothetical protein
MDGGQKKNSPQEQSNLAQPDTSMVIIWDEIDARAAYLSFFLELFAGARIWHRGTLSVVTCARKRFRHPGFPINPVPGSASRPRAVHFGIWTFQRGDLVVYELSRQSVNKDSALRF